MGTGSGVWGNVDVDCTRNDFRVAGRLGGGSGFSGGCSCTPGFFFCGNRSLGIFRD